MKDFEAGLDRALRKAEIEYRAASEGYDHCYIPWLDGSSVETLARDLRSYGFKIREIMDEQDTTGEWLRWVVTTNGVIAYCGAPVMVRRHGK